LAWGFFGSRESLHHETSFLAPVSRSPGAGARRMV
jgi:hypothetical protein